MGPLEQQCDEGSEKKELGGEKWNNHNFKMSSVGKNFQVVTLSDVVRNIFYKRGKDRLCFCLVRCRQF